MDYPDDRHLTRYTRKLTRGWPLLLAATLAAGVAAAVWSKLIAAPVYQARAVLLIRQPQAARPLPPEAMLLLPGLLSSTPGDQRSAAMAALRSRGLGRKVLRALARQGIFAGQSEREALRALQERVRVESGKEGQIVISALAPTPEQAAAIVDAHVTALMEYRQRENATLGRHHLLTAREELARVKEELATAEEALRAFQQRAGTAALRLSADATLKQLLNTEAELAVTRIGLAEARRGLETLRARLGQGLSAEATPVLPEGSPIASLRDKLADLEAELAVATTAYTEAHPLVRTLRAAVSSTRASLREQLRDAAAATDAGVVPGLADLEVAVIAGEAREKALQAERDRIQARVRQLPAAGTEFIQLARDALIRDRVFVYLAQALAEAELAATQGYLPLTVLDRAEPPHRKHGPRAMVNTAFGLLSGFVVSLFVALVLDWWQCIRQKSASGRAAHTPPPWPSA
ncbi:MAG: hypothetical protein GX774_20970 [Armatimonadetes bacterium]|nr:hypothetical protein [Armatimonadota bacterium]